jgi:hypothetical protein
LLERCVRAVLADEATSEVVVVIDGDDPPSARAMAAVAADDCRVRVANLDPKADPRSRAQTARQLGARMARSDVLLSLDDDVVVGPGLVTGHARRHADDDGLVVVGYMPVRRRAPGEEREPGTVRLYREGYERACRRYRDDPESILRGLWAGNVSVRRAHWLAVPELPPGEATAHIDRRFGRQLAEAGLRGVFDPGLLAEHWYERSPHHFLVGAGEMAVDDARQGENTGRAHRLAPLGRLVRPAPVWRVVASVAIATAELAWKLRLDSVERAILRLASRLAYERAR